MLKISLMVSKRNRNLSSGEFKSLSFWEISRMKIICIMDIKLETELKLRI